METLEQKKTLSSILRLNLNTILLISVYVLSFAIPALFGQPQLLIGSIVNFLIAYSVLKFGLKKTLPVLILPSSSALITGLLFAGATPFIVYFIPFIVVANGILALGVRYTKNIWGVLMGSIFKAAFLFLVANILVRNFGVPNVFLTSMGYIQLVTAVVGSGIAYLTFSLSERKFR